MKIRITVPGWDSFSGLFGTVEFENGVSVRDVTEQEALRIGANLNVVRIDTDEQVGAAAVDNSKIEAPTIEDADRTHEKPKPKETKVVNVVKEEKEDETPSFTKEQLELIADKKGIKGIREIAAMFDVKGVQIAQLIEGILQAQGK